MSNIEWVLNACIGWYGKQNYSGTKTHLVIDGKPACGYKPAKSMEFIFCFSLEFAEQPPECPRCAARLSKLRVRQMPEGR